MIQGMRVNCEAIIMGPILVSSIVWIEAGTGLTDTTPSAITKNKRREIKKK